MDEQTNPPFAPAVNGKTESTVFGLSSRSLIVFLICGTVCAECLTQCLVWAYLCWMTKNFTPFKVEEPLYSLVIMTVGYYFGQNQQKTANTIK